MKGIQMRCRMRYRDIWMNGIQMRYIYGVATISRLLKMIGLFCKRDL